MNLFYLSLVCAVLLPSTCLADVIGLDPTITLPRMTVLTGQGEYGDVFNLFFTIMTISGLFSVFFKNVIRLFRRRFD